VLDGEIAVPDARGVTHIDGLNDAIAGRPQQLAYFAFDLLHLDGQDLRHCPIEERKALLRDVLEAGSCERIVYVDHIIGRGAELFDKVRAVGAEGIVSKRLGSLYRGNRSRDWLKTKCHEVGQFVITGFQELGEGRLEALHVASDEDGMLKPAGQVRFGLAGKGLWNKLDALRCGPAHRAVVPVPPMMRAHVKFFGRYKGGAIRDGVLLSVQSGTIKVYDRCGARTRRGTVCQSPAMPNGRCRIHGGRSPGAPRGERNGRWSGGFYTPEAQADRRRLRGLIRQMRETMDELP
jgi:bifunctional non-homologous end joining protein LigD